MHGNLAERGRDGCDHDQAGFDVLTESQEVRRRVGYLPESVPLYPEMRVHEYLRFRGKLRGMQHPELAGAIGRVTDRCWLGDFIDRPIGQLSKGMRQRVGLADAIMHEPEVLILDEPTLGLDPTQIRETRYLIRELGERHTVLLSSHILHEVEQVCHRTIIIASGRIVASGSPQELRDQFGAKARVIAELRGPTEDVARGVRALDGVESVELTPLTAKPQAVGSAVRTTLLDTTEKPMVPAADATPGAREDGWVRLAVQPKPQKDIREDLFRLTTTKGWSLREIRREGATLEDFFIQVTTQQRDGRQDSA